MVELFNLAKLAVDQINCFWHTLSFLHRLKIFGYDLSDEQLYFAIQLVEGYIISDNGGGGGRRCLRKNEKKHEFIAKKHLEKIQAGLLKKCEILNKSMDLDVQVDWWYYIFNEERKLKPISKKLRNWQYNFTLFVILAKKSR